MILIPHKNIKMLSFVFSETQNNTAGQLKNCFLLFLQNKAQKHG